MPTFLASICMVYIAVGATLMAIGYGRSRVCQLPCAKYQPFTNARPRLCVPQVFQGYKNIELLFCAGIGPMIKDIVNWGAKKVPRLHTINKFNLDIVYRNQTIDSYN